MDLLKRFIEYLEKNNASYATIKNYRADVGQFIKWIENEFNKPFNPKDITAQLIDVYNKSKSQYLSPSQGKLSPRSFERHLSSLRKFFHFLKIQGVISKNPFEAISNSFKNASSSKDKWHLTQFKNYLYVYNLAHLTIKNYVNDIKHFLNWLEQVTGINNAWDIREKNVFEKINPILINEYKERLLQNFSPKTINRKLSSLRKYLTFAQEQGLIKTDQLSLRIKNEKIERRHAEFISASSEILKQVQDDNEKVQDDTKTVTLTGYSRFPPLRLLQKTTNGVIFVFDSFLVLPLASAIEQSKYFFWKIKGKPVFTKISNLKSQISNKSSNRQGAKDRIGNWKLEIGNYSKAMYAPLSISTAYFPLHRKVWHHVRHTRPKWYKKYHLYPIVHYFHFAILVILMSAIGFSLYNDLIFTPQNKNVLSALDTYEPRILAFKGRLTDSLDNPITSPNTPLRVIIYNDPAASSSALLWQEVVSVNPDSNGIFLGTLGVNEPIPQDIFSKNSSLWLGISIGQASELTPRQELATISYAVNAQTLQGLPAITNPDATTRNVILALDSSGNLNIGGSATPLFQATDGQFTLSGKVLLLTTVFGSESDVAISPDGLGKIDLQKPLQNTSENNNIPTAIGAVEVDDLFAVLATSSAQAAVTINQDGPGPIISASSSGTAKFTVENNGNIISVKGANWQPTFDSINGLNIASSSGIPFVTFDTLHQSVGIGTVIPETKLDVIGSFRASGNITLSKFISNGGILYATKSGSLAQVNAGTTTQCLMGGETPKFANCQASPYNNINEANGNIGIGTTTPLFKFDIQDSQSATVAAQIFNTNAGTDADGLIVKLGNTSTTAVNSANHFISFETSGIGIVGSIQGNGGKGVTYATSGPADFAEYFKKDENQNIEYGSLMCIDDKGFAVPCDNNNIKMIGIASEHPSFLGGENLGNKSVAVGLTGQVYTRVSNLNGDIKAGDLLTYSSIPGVAIKAVKAGQIIGKALEGFNTKESQQCYNQKTASDEAVYGGSEPVRGSDLSSNITITKTEENVNSQIKGSGPEGNRIHGTRLDRSDPNQSGPTPASLCGKILTLVNVSWYDPDVYLTTSGNLSIVQNTQNAGLSESQTFRSSDSLISPIASDSPSFPSLPNFSLVDSFGETIERIGGFTEIVVANLQAGLIKTEEITTNSISITTQSVIIAGINLKDYIEQIVSKTLNSQLSTLNSNRIISPIAEIDEIHTNLISPLASDSLRIHLSSESSKLIVENASGSAVATIDSSGNASFSGTLSSNQLEVNSDATVGGTLRAKRILAENIEGLEGKISTLAANYIKVNQESGIRNNGIEPPRIIHDSSFIIQDFNLSSYSAQLALTNLSSAFGTFTQGLMSFGPTSLAETSIAGPLYIQGSLILADNSINVLRNDLQLQPLRQGGISILAGLLTIDENGNLKVQGKAEFAKDVSIKGDLVAYGSGTFSKINLSLVQPALAISQTEIIATGSAGVAAIKEHQKELTIINKLITEKSLIYITPVGTPSSQSLFLMRQTLGESFTVGIQTPSLQDTLFNWLVVN